MGARADLTGPEQLFAGSPTTPQLKAIAFDADDTLWDCQGTFAEVERQFYALMSPWLDADGTTQRLLDTEKRNMPLYGYGVKAFTLSLFETAAAIIGGDMPHAVVGSILAFGRTLLSLPATPLPHVEATLSALRASGRYKLAVFTKGELQDQEGKLRRSGLKDYFDEVSIVSDKTTKAFVHLCRELGTRPDETLMVGNSLPSDIAPALEAGLWTAHVPYHITWAHEHMDAFTHPRMATIARIGQLIGQP